MPPVLPAPSASLILIRENDQCAEVLVGRRRSDLRFLPGIYAFPGGRLDRDDLRPSGFAEPLNAPPPGIDYRKTPNNRTVNATKPYSPGIPERLPRRLRACILPGKCWTN